MKAKHSSNLNQYLGLFFEDKQQLWVQVRKIASKSNSWIYITDEHLVNEVHESLELKNILKKGQVYISSDFHLREQVVRAKPVIEAIKKK
jgi:hypothetical protein